MTRLTIEPDPATREAFIEAMQKCIEEAYIKLMGGNKEAAAQMRQLIPGGVHAYFARPLEDDPHHVPYQMFCKGMQFQRVRKPLNA
jgi:hypothetical protein